MCLGTGHLCGDPSVVRTSAMLCWMYLVMCISLLGNVWMCGWYLWGRRRGQVPGGPVRNVPREDPPAPVVVRLVESVPSARLEQGVPAAEVVVGLRQRPRRGTPPPPYGRVPPVGHRSLGRGLPLYRETHL